MLQRLYEVINKENLVPDDMVSQRQQGIKKFYIGKGNNYPLVRSIFKQRWWWQLGSGIDFDSSNFLWTQWRKNELLDWLQPLAEAEKVEGVSNPWNDQKLRIYGKMEDNYHLSNKKALFFNMTSYYEQISQNPFEVLPLTFHIEHGLTDPEFERFRQHFQMIEQEKQRKKLELNAARAKHDQEHPKDEYDSEEEEIENEEEFFNIHVPKNIWIMKPGENSNRGSGIFVCNTMREIQAEITSNAKMQHTHIIQKYIERPLLISNRKFDIRCYGLLTSINGNLKGYFYEDGYIRTSCKEFTLDNLANRFIHLTNDAVQKKSDDYGKFENGNKMSYQNLQKYIETNFPKKNINFHRDLLPQIRVSHFMIVLDMYRK